MFVCLSFVTCKTSKDVRVNHLDVVNAFSLQIDNAIFLYSPIKVGGFLNNDGLSYTLPNEIESLAANNPEISRMLINIIKNNENRSYKEVYLDTSITTNKYINFHTEKFFEDVSNELRKSKDISKHGNSNAIYEFPDVHLSLYFDESKTKCLLLTTSYFKDEPFKQEYFFLSMVDNQWRFVKKL